MKLQKIANVRIRYSGATAAALPTLDIGQFSLAGCHIEKNRRNIKWDNKLYSFENE